MKYNKKAHYFSYGIFKNRTLPVVLDPVLNDYSELVFGWGFKSTARKAREFAKDNQLPYLAIEDGFLRSLGLGVSNAVAMSYVFDEVGIYYNARQPSKLENLIRTLTLTTEQINRASLCISAIRQYKLSKYNQQTTINSDKIITPKILVIDQTQGDASVEGACADQSTFTLMLEKALNDNPNEIIWIKTHPDVISGKKKGYLYPLPFQHENIRLYSESINPWDLLNSAVCVYTVSSLMGFEALLAGCKVHCFGIPFYAGWGLTYDEQTCSRRNVNKTLEEVFHAAYIDYSHYVDPILNKPCDIERIISYSSDILSNQHQIELISMEKLSLWKKIWIKDYLNAWRFKDKSNSTPIRWGQSENTERNGYCIEDGFIRSVGLGVHFNRPISLVCDKRGIYFDARTESDLEYLLNKYQCTEWEIERARNLIQELIENRITKYNVGSDFCFEAPSNKSIILVPGQVEGDASIRFGSPKVKTNSQLLKMVREDNPDAFIIYKPHPDVVAGQRDNGIWMGDFTKYADHIETCSDMSALLNLVDEVHTMTSLSGFEALLRGKTVTTYGIPFYSNWGLTKDKIKCERRLVSHSLYSLCYIALVKYPTYNYNSKNITVEQAISILKSDEINLSSSFKFKRDILIKLKKLMNKIK